MSDRFVRFTAPNAETIQFGIIENDSIELLKQPPWLGLQKSGQYYSFKEVNLKAPVVPSKIVCIGLNYHAHVKESFSADKAPDKPLIFLKPPSSVIGPGDPIVHTAQSERVDYEAELGVVIGREAKNVDIENALSHVFGYTCVNDVTARDLQKIDGQWSRAKGFDTFCPVGPWIVNELDYKDVLVEGVLNDKVMQSGRTSQMIFDVPFLISYISSIMTLSPGDLISTGTPSGISPMKPGDKIEVKVENIGTLENKVIAP